MSELALERLSAELRLWTKYGTKKQTVHVLRTGQVIVDVGYFSLMANRAEALEARIEALQTIVAAKQNIIRSIQRTVNDHLDAEAALAEEEKRP